MTEPIIPDPPAFGFPDGTPEVETDNVVKWRGNLWTIEASSILNREALYHLAPLIPGAAPQIILQRNILTELPPDQERKEGAPTHEWKQDPDNIGSDIFPHATKTADGCRLLIGYLRSIEAQRDAEEAAAASAAEASAAAAAAAEATASS